MASSPGVPSGPTDLEKSESSDPNVFEVVVKATDRQTGKFHLKLKCGSQEQYYKYHFLLKDAQKRMKLIKNLKENMLSVVSSEYPLTLRDERTLKTWNEKDIAVLSDMFKDLCDDLDCKIMSVDCKHSEQFSDMLNGQPSLTIDKSVRQFLLSFKDRDKVSHCLVGYKKQFNFVMIDVNKFIENKETVSPTPPVYRTEKPSRFSYKSADDMEVNPGQTVGEGAKRKIMSGKAFSMSVRVSRKEHEGIFGTQTLSQLKPRFDGTRKEQDENTLLERHVEDMDTSDFEMIDAANEESNTSSSEVDDRSQSEPQQPPDVPSHGSHTSLPTHGTSSDLHNGDPTSKTGHDVSSTNSNQNDGPSSQDERSEASADQTQAMMPEHEEFTEVEFGSYDEIFLRTFDIMKTVCKMFPKVSVKHMESESFKIMMTGDRNEVKGMKKEIDNQLAMFNRNSVVLDTKHLKQEVIGMFAKESVKTFVKGELKNRFLECHWEIVGEFPKHYLRVYSYPQKMKEILEILKGVVSCKTLKMEDWMLQNKNIKTQLRNLTKKYNDKCKFIPLKEALVLVCCLDILTKVEQDLESLKHGFLEEKTKTVEAAEDVVKLCEDKLRHVIDDIEKEYKVTITYQSRGNKHGWVTKGCEGTIERANKALHEKLLNDFTTRTVAIGKDSAVSAYISGNKGSALIQKLEGEHKCMIRKQNIQARQIHQQKPVKLPPATGKRWNFQDGNVVALYKQMEEAMKDCEVLLEPVPKPNIASYNNFSPDTSAGYMKVEMQVCDSGQPDCVEQLENTFMECLGFIFAEQKKSVAIPINVQSKINWEDAEFLSQIISVLRKVKVDSKEYRFYVEEPSECQKFIPLMGQQLLDLGAETESGDEGVQDQGASGPAAPETKQEIYLKKGELAKQKCDVIVNTTSTDLKLQNGAVSHSLLKAAGSKIQEECSRKYRNGIESGDVAVTKGYKLQCEHVYHGALPGYSDTGVQIMRKFIAECLRLADRDKMTSIAFPALGTGNLGFPSAVVASTMYEVVRAFGRKHPNSSLTQIYFVIYQRDESTYKVFDAVQSQYKTVTPSLRPHAVDQPSPSASLHMKYGPTNLWISQEEVKNITADVLVLFWYPQEIFQNPVRKHGLLEAGEKVTNEWNQNRTKFSQHSKEVKIRMTYAGELPYKRIIHIRCENQYAEDILFQVLSRCHLMDYETAAIVYHQKTDQICSTIPAEKFAQGMDTALKSLNNKNRDNKLKRLEILTDATGLRDKLSSALRQTSSDLVIWDKQQQHAVGATAKASDNTATEDAEPALIVVGRRDDVDKVEAEIKRAEREMKEVQVKKKSMKAPYPPKKTDAGTLSDSGLGLAQEKSQNATSLLVRPKTNRQSSRESGEQPISANVLKNTTAADLISPPSVEGIMQGRDATEDIEITLDKQSSDGSGIAGVNKRGHTSSQGIHDLLERTDGDKRRLLLELKNKSASMNYTALNKIKDDIKACGFNVKVVHPFENDLQAMIICGKESEAISLMNQYKSSQYVLREFPAQTLVNVEATVNPEIVKKAKADSVWAALKANILECGCSIDRQAEPYSATLRGRIPEIQLAFTRIANFIEAQNWFSDNDDESNKERLTTNEAKQKDSSPIPPPRRVRCSKEEFDNLKFYLSTYFKDVKFKLHGDMSNGVVEGDVENFIAARKVMETKTIISVDGLTDKESSTYAEHSTSMDSDTVKCRIDIINNKIIIIGKRQSDVEKRRKKINELIGRATRDSADVKIPADDPTEPVLFTSQGIEVCVCQGDVVKLQVDCILNPVNEELKPIGTVASLVFRAAGAGELDKHLKDIKKQNKSPYVVGFTCYTKPGKLKCEYVIHVVVPVWSMYETHGKDMQGIFKDELGAAVFSGLKEADNMKMKSVAFCPGMATIEKDLCCWSYVKAVHDFSSKFPDSSLKSIHIVDLSLKNIQNMLEACRRYGLSDLKQKNTSAGPDQKYLLPKPISDRNDNSRDQQITSQQGLTQTQSSSGQSEGLGMKVIPYCITSDSKGRGTFVLENQVTLSIYTENILCVTSCKGLVVVCDEKLQPMDALGKHLEEQAGKPYMEEKEDVKRNHISKDLVVTKAGNLKHFEYILHMIMPLHSRRQESKAKVKEFLNELQGCLQTLFKDLEETHIHYINSIALPLFASEMAGDEMGTILKDAIVSYSSGRKRKEKLVIFIVNEQATKTELMLEKFNTWVGYQQSKQNKQSIFQDLQETTI